MRIKDRKRRPEVDIGVDVTNVMRFGWYEGILSEIRD
jgi:hypothetical protein